MTGRERFRHAIAAVARKLQEPSSLAGIAAGGAFLHDFMPPGLAFGIVTIITVLAVFFAVYLEG